MCSRNAPWQQQKHYRQWPWEILLTLGCRHRPAKVSSSTQGEAVIASKNHCLLMCNHRYMGNFLSLCMHACMLRETAKKSKHWRKVVLFCQKSVHCHHNSQSLSLPTPLLLSTGLSRNLQLILRLEFICFHINAINFHWKMHLRHSIKIGLK